MRAGIPARSALLAKFRVRMVKRGEEGSGIDEEADEAGGAGGRLGGVAGAGIGAGCAGAEAGWVEAVVVETFWGCVDGGVG